MLTASHTLSLDCHRRQRGALSLFVPAFEHFIDAASFYSWLGHEAARATGAKHPLGLTGRLGSGTHGVDEAVSTGAQTQEIARVLGLGEEAVRCHLKKAQRKLGVGTQREKCVRNWA